MEDDPIQQWPLRDEMEFVCLPSAARWARKHTTDVLRRWQLGSIAETTELLVSELITNAYKAAGVDVQRQGYMALVGVPTIKMRLASDHRLVLVEVWDFNPEPPVVKEADLEAEGGRGLFLVGCLSRQWNYYFPASGGKVVWCEIADGRGL